LNRIHFPHSKRKKNLFSPQKIYVCLIIGRIERFRNILNWRRRGSIQ
jgi:hypothetical protein